MRGLDPFTSLDTHVTLGCHHHKAVSSASLPFPLTNGFSDKVYQASGRAVS